jgi:hypothetical protein
VKNEAFHIDVHGASKLRASGETGRLGVKLSGAAMVDASGLRARAVEAVCDGAGFIGVNATETLDAVVNGVGSIEYSGDPETVNEQVNGVGRISRK